MLILTSQFSALAGVIYSWIRELNGCMEQINLEGNPRRRCGVVVLLSEIHSKLCDVCSAMQESYKLIRTLQVTSCFVQMIISVLYFYLDITTDGVFEISYIFPLRNDTLQMCHVIQLCSSVYITWNVVSNSTEISKED